MSNTYAEIKTTDVYEGNKILDFEPYQDDMSLSLTAFVSKSKKLQLTIQTNSTLPNQSGCAYITLNDAQIDELIFALLERKYNLISATGCEKSLLIPAK